MGWSVGFKWVVLEGEERRSGLVASQRMCKGADTCGEPLHDHRGLPYLVIISKLVQSAIEK